jgi:hypothetical protein
MHLVPTHLNHMFYLVAHGTQRRIFRRKSAHLQTACPGIVKKEFECYDPFTFRPIRIDIFVSDRSEYVASID